MHFTYILNNIDIDIAIFCKYRMEVVKSDIETSLRFMARAGESQRSRRR